jgi:hypothetical protein
MRMRAPQNFSRTVVKSSLPNQTEMFEASDVTSFIYCLWHTYGYIAQHPSPPSELFISIKLFLFVYFIESRRHYFPRIRLIFVSLFFSIKPTLSYSDSPTGRRKTGRRMTERRMTEHRMTEHWKTIGRKIPNTEWPNAELDQMSKMTWFFTL